jgi:hypothetical protein
MPGDLPPVYDVDFVFSAIGADHLTPAIQKARLFNVSFEPRTGDIKLYVLDASERFLYKLSHDSAITRQYAGDDPQYGGDPRRVIRHFGCQLDFHQVVIDAVEGDTYYLYLDDAGIEQKMRLARAVCRRYGLTEAQLLEAVHAVNKRRFPSLRKALEQQAISLVKVPLTGSDVKIYSRPFHSGNGYDLDSVSRAFLRRLHGCGESELSRFLRYIWVARDLLTDRLLIVTQNHALLHGDADVRT